MKYYNTLILVSTCLWHLTLVSTLPLDTFKLNNTSITNATLTINQTTTYVNHDVKSTNVSDSIVSASGYKTQKHHLPIIMKPRGFLVPKIRPTKSKQDSAQPAAQNYYSAFFPNIPSLDGSQPYYPLTEQPLVEKLLAQQFEQRSHKPLSNYDAGILGSGDFGILKGGTFYGDNESPYDIGNEEESSNIYYGEPSYANGGPSTEAFIQKYTYPEEQFAQFRDFADLNTPADSAFSQYVVVYAAKNSTHYQLNDSKPKNIFEQLQEIDKEKALKAKKLKKNSTNLSITKLKLVKSKLAEKKFTKKQHLTLFDDDPLLALS